MASPFEIVRYTIDPVTVTEIRAPFACSNVTILQEDEANNAKIVAGDDKIIPAGTEEHLTPPKGDGLHRWRWNENDKICDAYSIAGTGPLVVSFCL